MKLNSIFRKYGIIVVLVVLICAFGIGNSLFFTASNFINIIRQISILGIITIGMSFVLISGGIDLSVGSQLSFIGVVTATMLTKYNINPLFACIIGILFATLVGITNGVFIANTKVPPLVATVATQQILLGLGYVISGGKPIYGLTPSVKFIGQGYIGPIPTPIIILIIIIIIGSFILNKTYLGRYFYAVGSNDEAARLSGIDVIFVRVIAYAMCGLLCGIAAIIMMSRINSGSPTVGGTISMDVLTAAVIGGVSINGGEGKVFGAMIGVLVIGVLSNGLIIMNISEYYQMIIKGIVLACAIAFDSMNFKKLQSKAL